MKRGGRRQAAGDGRKKLRAGRRQAAGDGRKKPRGGRRQAASGGEQKREAGLNAVVDRLQHFYGVLPAPPRDAFGLYVWEVLAFQTTPQRRDTAMAALRQLRALTPDAMARVARGPLEAAVTLAGSLREERLRALVTGAAAFRRCPDLIRLLKAPLPEARAALTQLPHLTDAAGEWLLLFAGDQPMLPADPRAIRTLARLGYGNGSAQDLCSTVAADLKGDVDALRRAILYLSHHGLIACTDLNPHCVVCPLLKDCPEGQARTNQPQRSQSTQCS